MSETGFVAMNRFRIRPGCENEFEELWTSRDSHLNGVAGFVEFRLLKGASNDEYTLYSSHTLWQRKEDFEAWTHSEAFRKAHEGASTRRHLYLGAPQFEGFESVQRITST